MKSELKEIVETELLSLGFKILDKKKHIVIFENTKKDHVLYVVFSPLIMFIENNAENKYNGNFNDDFEFKFVLIKEDIKYTLLENENIYQLFSDKI